ncbi:hypothetical protein [Aquihabitans sp. McL0605]|uniref:hypothetical protein n=1 Tax=Aquihabitans sp. McL0605 TaxID=3415671 RepID=UPI003CED1875
MAATGTGPLTPADDHLNHQFADTFAVVAQNDRSWTEKVCATAYARDGSLQLALGLGKYANRGVIDAYAGVSRGDEQWTVRASRDLTPDVDRCTIGPIRYEIVEPMRTVRFSLEANEIVPVSFEWTFHHAVPPAMEEREQHRSLGGARVDADVVRYHQTGTASGWVEVDGERTELDPAAWISTRDHSWGVRYQVGAPATDVPYPPKISAFGSFTVWMPALLEAPDGTRSALHLYLQRRTGDGRTNVHLQGGIEHADGTIESFASVDPQLRFQDDNRRLLGGVLRTRTIEGVERDFTVEVPSATGFHLGPGLYFGFDGRHHGQWHGPLDVTGEHITDCADPAVARRIHQHRDCVVHLHDEASGLRGWGNAQTIAIGAHPDLGLTRESSFI